MTAELRWTSAPDQPHAVVLVLHGGREHSTAPTRWSQPAVLRMVPFAWSLRHRGGGGLAVARLRYDVRGWNESAASPLPDTRNALEQVRGRYPGVPIGLLGHSMGARVALHLADEDGVEAVVALAAWVERSDTAHGRPGLPVLLVHGTSDRMTDPRGSALMARLLTEQGADVELVELPGGDHPMLRRPWVWHRLATDFLTRVLLGRDRAEEEADRGRTAP